MRDKFVTDTFVLDLRDIKISYTETSPRFKDTFFTKYSFPFEFYLDRNLKMKIGDYSNVNATDLLKKYEGFHIFEGKINKGVLEILEVEGNLIRAQIDSGFDDLPNFDKKLSELPFKTVSVPNIYHHAEDVCKKKYPEVNYNFPCVIYNKHIEEKKSWEYFNQFLNDRDENGFVNNNENASDSSPHVNRNIIHPMPYLLYVLKQGFLDAGFELAGDVLNDSDFKQRVIYNNKEVFRKNEHPSINIEITADDIKTNKYPPRYSLFSYGIKEILLDSSGKWSLKATAILTYGFTTGRGFVEIYLNGVSIYFKEGGRGTTYLNISLDFYNTIENGELYIVIHTATLGSGSFTGNLNLTDYLNFNHDTIFQIHNDNEISLTDYVPDMTFGELITIVKNWKNYDLEIKGSKVYMNRLRISNVLEMKNIKDFEIETPVKTFVNKRSYLLSFVEMDNEDDNFDEVFIDYSGVKLNGTAKESTTEVKINGYCLPIETFRGKTTAISKKDDSSVLSLIHYDGLKGEQNTATNPPGLMTPDILNIWSKWYQMRINTSELKWSFIVNKNKFRHIKIRDTLYGYKQKLWIKELTKTVLDERNYKVDIVAEIIR